MWSPRATPALRPFGRAADLDLEFGHPDRAGLVSRLLASCTGNDDAEYWWSQTVGRRTAALLRLVALSEGREQMALSACCSAPGCGEAFDYELPLPAVAALGDDEAPVQLPSDDGATALTLRRPTGDDLRRWRATRPATREAALQLMLDSLVIDGGATTRVAEVEAAYVQADPLVAFRAACTCPGCGAANEVEVDLETLALRRLASRQRALLEEVHVFATAYGWTEAEVMALPPAGAPHRLPLADRGWDVKPAGGGYFDALMRAGGLHAAGPAPALVDPAAPWTDPAEVTVAASPVTPAAGVPPPPVAPEAARTPPPRGEAAARPAQSPPGMPERPGLPVAPTRPGPVAPAPRDALVQAAMRWVAAGPQPVGGEPVPTPDPAEPGWPAVQAPPPAPVRAEPADPVAAPPRSATADRPAPAAVPHTPVEAATGPAPPRRDAATAKPLTPAAAGRVGTAVAAVAASALPAALRPAPQPAPVEVTIGSIHLRVDAPAAQTVTRPAPRTAPAATTAPAPRSALARRALRRI